MPQRRYPLAALAATAPASAAEITAPDAVEERNRNLKAIRDQHAGDTSRAVGVPE